MLYYICGKNVITFKVPYYICGKNVITFKVPYYLCGKNIITFKGLYYICYNICDLIIFVEILTFRGPPTDHNWPSENQIGNINSFIVLSRLMRNGICCLEIQQTLAKMKVVLPPNRIRNNIEEALEETTAYRRQQFN